MSPLTALVLDRFPAREWQDGDCVITNDLWIATGHLPDIAMITGPAVFEERESSCWFGLECRIRVDSDLTLLVDLEP